MAGGTWKKQDKRQPGVYINVRSDMNPVTKLGERGVVAICEPLSWGPEGAISVLGPEDDYTPFIGYGKTETKARSFGKFLRGVIVRPGRSRSFCTVRQERKPAGNRRF